MTTTLLATFQKALRHAPDHPMSNHLLIHAVEAARPLQGLEEDKWLENLVPGSGHFVHMPPFPKCGRDYSALGTVTGWSLDCARQPGTGKFWSLPE